MNSFAKEFLRDNVGTERQIFLGAFGKHPGWDDHIDDIGLETESLVEAKRLLYLEGISAQIGAWEQLDGGATIEFRHVFVWQREGQTLIGRMWTSSDGKKRTRYPMVVCAHCVGTSLPFVLEILLPWLEEMQTRAMATKSPDDVREMVAQFRDALRAWLVATDETDAPPEFDAEAFFNEIDLVGEEDRMVKTLWQLHESQYAAGKYKPRTGWSPEHVRVLASAASPSRSIYFWKQVLASQLDPSAPVLLAVPLDQYWMDVIAGEPTPRELFSLRASPRALSLAGDGASEPPDSFRETAREILQHAAAGRQDALPTGAPTSWMSRLLGR